MSEQLDLTKLPLTPYNNTSGYSGTDTSRERAEREDNDGTTSYRQRETLSFLHSRGALGATWKELGERYNWHHGQASGVLSVLHKEGIIVRLVQRRDKCAVYVLPQFVNGRVTSERKDKTCPNSAWHK